METEDYVELDGVRICKPFVEKPASGGWCPCGGCANGMAMLEGPGHGGIRLACQKHQLTKSAQGQAASMRSCCEPARVHLSALPPSPAQARTTMSTFITRTAWAAESSGCSVRWTIGLVTMTQQTRGTCAGMDRSSMKSSSPLAAQASEFNRCAHAAICSLSRYHLSRPQHSQGFAEGSTPPPVCPPSCVLCQHTCPLGCIFWPCAF